MLGPRPSGPTLRCPTFYRFGPPLFGGPPFVVQKFNIPKLAEVEIGRSRNWPKLKLAEVEKKVARSRPRSRGPPSWLHHDTHQIQKWIGQNWIGPKWIGQNTMAKIGLAKNGLAKNGQIRMAKHGLSRSRTPTISSPFVISIVVTVHQSILKTSCACTFEGPGLLKTPPKIQREDTQRETKRAIM